MIPTPVLEAKDLADKVVKLETQINTHYKKTKKLQSVTFMLETYEQFKEAYIKVAQRYPEHLSVIPNVTIPIHKRKANEKH